MVGSHDISDQAADAVPLSLWGVLRGYGAYSPATCAMTKAAADRCRDAPQ